MPRIIQPAPQILHRAVHRGDLRINQLRLDREPIDSVIYILATATLLVGVVAWLGI